MTTPELIFAAVVLFVGVPAAVRNPTAVALVASWVVTTALWYLIPGGQAPLNDPVSGNTIRLGLDALVIAIVFCKLPAFDCFPYGSLTRQLACFWLERSLADRVVLAAFPLMWAAYFLAGDWLQWWSLYWLSLAQFIAAGGEALSFRLARRAANAPVADVPDIPSSGAEFALAGGRWDAG